MKKPKPMTKDRCLAIASSGVLTCVLDRGHSGPHSTSTSGRKASQHATWTTTATGRISVTTYARGKKQGEWFEDPAKPGPGVAPQVQDPEADAAAQAALEAEEDRRASRWGCEAPFVGTDGREYECEGRNEHNGSHYAWSAGARVTIYASAEQPPAKFKQYGFVLQVSDGGVLCHDGEFRALSNPVSALDHEHRPHVFATKQRAGSQAYHLERATTIVPYFVDEGGHTARAGELAASDQSSDVAPRAPMTLEDEPEDPAANEAALAAMDAQEGDELDDPFEDEVRSDEDRAFARQQREAREAHAAELDAAQTKPETPKCYCGGANGKAKPHQLGAKSCKITKRETCCCSGAEHVTHMLGAPGCEANKAKAVKELPAPASSTMTFRNVLIDGQRTDLEVHPAADIFDMLEGPSFDEVRDDIAAHGLRQRPVLDEHGLLVDGRNRLRICQALGIDPGFDRLDPGTDVVAYIISVNLRRRHMNESARAMAADELATGKFAGPTQKQAAALMNVSERSARDARRVRENALPEVVKAVKQGKVAVSAAAQLATLPKAKQREIYEREIEPKKTEVKAGKIRALANQEKKREVVRKINEGRVAPLPEGPFGVIYGDYPWWYDNSDQHEGSRGHIGYPPMKMEEILAHAREVAKRAARDCILALWVTNLYIPKIGSVIEAYGAEHHTMVTWPKVRAGTGMWPRGQTEHLVIASIGSPVHTLNEITTLLPSWKPERPGEHSSKPAEVAELLAKHCGGPFLELFGRGPRDGWVVWGAEVDKFAEAA